MVVVVRRKRRGDVRGGRFVGLDPTLPIQGGGRGTAKRRLSPGICRAPTARPDAGTCSLSLTGDFGGALQAVALASAACFSAPQALEDARGGGSGGADGTWTRLGEGPGVLRRCPAQLLLALLWLTGCAQSALTDIPALICASRCPSSNHARPKLTTIH